MKKTACWLLLSFIFCSCTTPPSSLTNSLDSLYSELFPADQPGGSVLILKGDSVLFSKSYGLADLTTKSPITENTLFNLGSISKTFVAYAVLHLVEQKKISLEDSILQYFPTFKNKELVKGITIRHLLTHTSGLPDIRNVAADTVFYLSAKDAENWAPILQADALLFEPGSQYEYSNPAFNGLALIIEQVSGVKWQRYVDSLILKPSGMIHSTITDGAFPREGVAHAYVKNNNQWTEDDYGEEPTFAAAGNGGVWSSISELAFYEKAIQKNVFLSAENVKTSREEVMFPNWKEKESPFIGLCWFINEPDYGIASVSHTGTQGGFYCNYVYLPTQDILYIQLSNSPLNQEELAKKTFALLRVHKVL